MEVVERLLYYRFVVMHAEGLSVARRFPPQSPVGWLAPPLFYIGMSWSMKGRRTKATTPAERMTREDTLCSTTHTCTTRGTHTHTHQSASHVLISRHGMAHIQARLAAYIWC